MKRMGTPPPSSEAEQLIMLARAMVESDRTLAECVAAVVCAALEKNGGNKMKTTRALGISRVYLDSLIHRHNIRIVGRWSKAPSVVRTIRQL